MAVNVKNAFIGSPRISGGVLFRAPLGTKLRPMRVRSLTRSSATTALSVRTV
jgi:hypothetical protein